MHSSLAPLRGTELLTELLVSGDVQERHFNGKMTGASSFLLCLVPCGMQLAAFASQLGPLSTHCWTQNV